MLFKLLTLPISAPVSGFKFVLEQLQNVAEAELYDVDRIREQLLLLQLRLDEGELTEEEYVEREAEIIARLREARARQRAQVPGADEPVTYVIEGHGRED
jgi:hypothetical protein